MLCLNKYATPAALNHHMSTTSHTYSCNHCDKVFPSERYLRRHLRIHSDVDSFVCKLCNKGFRTESYLKVHMLTHSTNKPYACSMCVAAFNRKDKLKRHLLIHEPVKRYKCPFNNHSGCDREFNRPDKLKAHILTHSSAKPFICHKCGQVFCRVAQFRKHLSTSEECSENSEECNWCGIKFSSNKDSARHRCKDMLALQKVAKNSLKQKSRLPFGTGRHSRSLRRHYQLKKSKKSKGKPIENDLDASELVDDIPTAHIEIISANTDLVPVSSISHFSLPPNFETDSAQSQFDEVLTNVVNTHSDSCEVSNFCSIPLDECTTLQETVDAT